MVNNLQRESSIEIYQKRKRRRFVENKEKDMLNKKHQKRTPFV
jgi:hypothetical protein